MCDASPMFDYRQFERQKRSLDDALTRAGHLKRYCQYNYISYVWLLVCYDEAYAKKKKKIGSMD